MKLITLIISIILLLQYSKVNSQSITIQEGLDQYGSEYSSVSNFIADKGFRYIASTKSSLGGRIMYYERRNDYGKQKLNILVRNNMVLDLMWSEHIYFASNILDEVLKAGFIEKTAEFATKMFVNNQRRLAILLMNRDNGVIIHIYKLIK